jgi:hypothetical protein
MACMSHGNYVVQSARVLNCMIMYYNVHVVYVYTWSCIAALVAGDNKQLGLSSNT